MFNISFEKSFSVEMAHFNSNIFSESDYRRIKRSMCTISLLKFKSFSKFDHQFSLSFLKNKIRQNLSTNIDYTMTLNNPFINPTIMSRVFLKDRSSMFFRLVEVSKMILNPVKKFLFSVGNIKYAPEGRILISVILSRINAINTDRTFSVDYSSKICKFERIISNLLIGNFRHLFTPLLCV